MDNTTTIKRAQITIILLSVTIIALFGVRLAVLQRLSTEGEQLGRLEESITRMTVENEKIKGKVLHFESFQTITNEAHLKGYAKTTQRNYIYLQ